MAAMTAARHSSIGEATQNRLLTMSRIRYTSPMASMLSRSTKLPWPILPIIVPRLSSELDSCTRVDDCVTPYCRIASARKSTTMNTTAYSQPGQARCLGFGVFVGSTVVMRSSSTSVVAAAAGMDGLDAGVVSCDGSFNAWGSLCTMWFAPNP